MTAQRRPLATGNDPGCLHVESSRLPYDDGHSANRQGRLEEIQAYREVDGWTDAGPNAASRMRQEGRAIGTRIEYGSISDTQSVERK